MKRRILSGSAYSLGAVLYATVALLALGKLLTNALSPYDVGQVALILLLGEFLGLCCGLGLPAALPKLLAATTEEEQHQTQSTLFRFQIQLAIAVSLATMVVIATHFWWPPSLRDALPHTAALLSMLPLLVIVIALRDFLLAAAAGRHAYGRRAQAITALSTLQVAQFAMLYALGIQEPACYVGAHVIAGLGGIGLLLRDSAGQYPPGGKGLEHVGETTPTQGVTVPPTKTDAAVRFSAWRRFRWPVPTPPAGRARVVTYRAIQFSTPLYVNNLMNFIYQRVDTLLVVAWLGLGTAAVFEMVKRLPSLLSRLLRATLIPYLPSLSELIRDNNHTAARTLIQQAATFTAFAGYTITLFIIAVEGPLLGLLFTAEYQQGAAALGPLLVATCLAVQAGIMGQALIALDRPKTVMYINLGLAAISLTLNLLLVPRYGIGGAGWSAVTAAGFSYLLQRHALSRAGIPLGIGRGMLVHGLFGTAFGLNQIVATAMAPRLAVAMGFITLCLVTGTISTRMLRQKVRP